MAISAKIPTTTWTGYIEIEDNTGSSERVPVKVCATPPKNLALDAKAGGSSNAPEADKIEDGYASAWRSAKKEQEKEIAQEQEQGIWVQLSWDELVKFSRVVINEGTTETVGIKSWKPAMTKIDR